jgi:hypothetical protein
MQPQIINSTSTEKPSAADELDQIIGQVRSLLRRSAEDIVEIGRQLLRAKELLAHGDFGPWLKHEFEMSERSAQNFMNVARRFGDKSEMVADLKPGILYLLAAPSTPQTVIDRVLSGKVPAVAQEVDAAIDEERHRSDASLEHVASSRRRHINAKDRNQKRAETKRSFRSQSVQRPPGRDAWPDFLRRFEHLVVELACDFGITDADGLAEATCRELGRDKSRAFATQHLPTLRAMVAVLEAVDQRTRFSAESTSSSNTKDASVEGRGR